MRISNIRLISVRVRTIKNPIQLNLELGIDAIKSFFWKLKIQFSQTITILDQWIRLADFLIFSFESKN